MSHPAPKRPNDPDGDKSRALKLAAHAAHRADIAESARNAAIRFAADSGASLRELAEATGLGHMTVKRIIERVRTGDALS
jgi:DNA invertase Pin-like site-specific DNA recombinase